MLKAVHTGSHQNAQASQAALLHPARPAQAESPLARMQHAFGNQRLLRLANGGMLRGDLVQRKPDKEKADAVPVCNPTPKTLAQMRAITGEPLTLGFTSPEITPLDWQVQFKAGKCSVKSSRPKLGFKHFIFTKAGRHRFGAVVNKTETCKGKSMDHTLVITAPMAELLKLGEIEHCQDAHRAFDLSWRRYDKACQGLASGFPADSEDVCKTAVRERLSKAVGVDPSKWHGVADCLFAKSTKRDTEGWHTVDFGAGVFEKDCKGFTTTPDPKTSLTEIGKHSSDDLVKGCGE